ncbi:MAG: phosphatidate cytidylyltransferase [Gammaproteobacteria bacterium]
MFKQRLLTAVLLIPLVLFLIYYANDPLLIGIIGMIVIAMAWEWTALIPVSSSLEKILFVAGLAITIGIFQLFFKTSLSLNLIFWLGGLLIVVTYPKTRSMWGQRWLLVPAAWVFLSVFAICLWYLFHQHQGRTLLVYLLGLVWATDIGAYVFGKLWGTHRLIPQVSPGKTLEGALGGLIFGMVVAFAGLCYFKPVSIYTWFAQACALIAISMLGDLWISVLKRRVQIKDTGNILPGHGGVLDRLDSLLACLPFFYYFYFNY